MGLLSLRIAIIFFADILFLKSLRNMVRLARVEVSEIIISKLQVKQNSLTTRDQNSTFENYPNRLLLSSYSIICRMLRPLVQSVAHQLKSIRSLVCSQ